MPFQVNISHGNRGNGILNGSLKDSLYSTNEPADKVTLFSAYLSSVIRMGPSLPAVVESIAWQSSYLKESFEVLIDLYEYLTKEIKQITKSIIELSRIDKYAQRMRLIQSIPGVGILTGMEILVEVQNFTRFKTSEEIAAYIGLTPSEYSTGPYVRQGRITRCGNKRVRVALIESSWILVGKDPLIRAKYLKLKSSKGAKRAIVAIARKLIIRIRVMLLQNAPYRTSGTMLQAA